jgi:hypothetical protein
LVGRPDGKRSLWRSRYRWENNIQVGFQDVGWGGMNGLIWLRIGTVGGCLWMR